MPRNVTHPIGVILLAAALLAAAVQVQALCERQSPPRAGEDDALAVTSPAAIRRFAGAYAAVGADVYWVRAIQYYGGIKRRLAPRRPRPPDPPQPAAPVPPESPRTTRADGAPDPMP